MSASEESMEKSPSEPAAGHKPYIPDEQVVPEFTWPALIVGALLGILFGASSLYLLLKVGMTVSASVPIAVLSITLFRAFSRSFGFRRATILENNIVQTAGSAGESLAFGVGVTMPALLLLGFEMDPVRVMTVSVLGGALGILMMIPLRRAFIVKQHGKLKYPEGTACAEVLVAGEKGGASAKMVFIGFGIAFVYKLLGKALKLWPESPEQNLYHVTDTGAKVGFKGASVTADLTPEMLGVGYLIGPRIACMMMSGAVISFFVIGPLIATIGDGLKEPVSPGRMLIHDMTPDDIYNSYLRYIGAGAVAAGGIISMFRAIPLIISSIAAGLRDLRSSAAGGPGAVRTERDLPMSVVIFGSIGLVLILALVPQLGLGFTLEGILGAFMILLFGFLFVTVSSRLTGEVGSSSNPISGMTIATLLLTCLIFVLVGKSASGSDRSVFLTSLSIAAVVCIASSNGGTTSQDLKTGYLVGATPKYQQYAILVGALTSAVVIGGTMLVLNRAWTCYTKKDIPDKIVQVPPNAPRQKVGQPYDGRDEKLGKDDRDYRAVYFPSENSDGVTEGWYLADDSGRLTYKMDVPIKRQLKKMDNGEDAPEKFKAPQPQLFALIIEGILGGNLEWTFVIIGVLIAVTMELLGISALPVAVGMYLGLGTATPIFVGGILRWLADRSRGVSASEAETETSPSVLLSSGYIAGGTLCGLLIGFLVMLTPKQYLDQINAGQYLGPAEEKTEAGPTVLKPDERVEKWHNSPNAKIVALGAFLALCAILLRVGTQKSPPLEESSNRGAPTEPL